MRNNESPSAPLWIRTTRENFEHVNHASDRCLQRIMRGSHDICGMRDDIIMMSRKTDSSNGSVTCDGQTQMRGGEGGNRGDIQQVHERHERRVRTVVYVRYHNDKSESDDAQMQKPRDWEDAPRSWITANSNERTALDGGKITSGVMPRNGMKYRELSFDGTRCLKTLVLCRKMMQMSEIRNWFVRL